MLTLRPYQKAACDAAKEELRKSVEPILIDASPASGKSYMVAELANWLHKISNGKRVLCLAPSRSLIEQNVEKYRITGEPCSVFSASAGVKSTRHFVVFATPKTVSNSISRFNNGSYCAVVIDEAHGLTPTVLSIIEEMREGNPNLRVIGLSGTCYRMGSGYIFKEWPDGRINGEDKARDPYFGKCVYSVSPREMLDQGFITPMEIGQINAEKYDTSGLELLPNGHFKPDGVERAFVGHGRQTAQIVADVIEQSRNRKGGIMYFAATRRHAQEIFASLPPENSALSTGDGDILFGKVSTEKEVIKAYKSGKVRHFVSCSKYTTGFDAPWTEVIAMLRKVESNALLQQCMGRAWRLHDGKDSCLLLDYGTNVEDQFPDGDIYKPLIRAKAGTQAGKAFTAHCPDCGYGNAVTVKKDCADYRLDENGYCLDVFGDRIQTDYGPMSGHWGRRCFGQVKVGREYERCSYYWTSRECDACGEKCDITARHCPNCDNELIDPAKKLVSEFRALKRDPTRLQTDVVISLTEKESVSQRGNKTIRTDWVTPHRQFSIWFSPEARHPQARRDWAAYQDAIKHGQPETISYRKDESFWRCYGYGHPADDIESFTP